MSHHSFPPRLPPMLPILNTYKNQYKFISITFHVTVAYIFLADLLLSQTKISFSMKQFLKFFYAKFMKSFFHWPLIVRFFACFSFHTGYLIVVFFLQQINTQLKFPKNVKFMRYCQRIYIKYFSNFKRTHRIDFCCC